MERISDAEQARFGPGSIVVGAPGPAQPLIKPAGWSRAELDDRIDQILGITDRR